MALVIGGHRARTPEEKKRSLRAVSFIFRVIAAAMLLTDAAMLFFGNEPPRALTIIPAVFLVVSLGLSLIADRVKTA